jgi:N-acetylneuraminic acid mutarotase
MIVARQHHTATLLANGQLLVAGGQDSRSLPEATFELYDPTTGTWNEPANNTMVNVRYYHTATLLQNGEVLVTGGLGSISPIASAEIYDPSTEKWTLTASMNAARFQHTATLLPSGKVLVAGGDNAGTAEIFDPNGNNGAGTWTPAGPLNSPRFLHTATLLADGRVLAAGGDNFAALQSAEIFDPNGNGGVGSWTTTGSMTTTREQHTATLLPDGKVLAAGGEDATSTPLSSAEVFDPATNAWTATTNSMPATSGRFAHTSTLLPSGKVAVVGGKANGGALGDTEIFDPGTDPVSGTWSAGPSLVSARFSHTTTLLPSGALLAAGGGSTGTLDRSETYDPAVGSWSPTNPLPTSDSQNRASASATLLANGTVLIAGGFDGTSYLSNAVIFNPASGNWTTTGSLTTARASHTATLLPSGLVLVAGGVGSTGAVSSAEMYDPSSGTWSTAGNMSSARAGHAAALFSNGVVVVSGGQDSNGAALKTAEVFNPTTNKWSTVGSLNVARAHHTATLLPSGGVLVAGGDNGGASLSSFEVFNGSGWTIPSSPPASPSMTVARTNHTATLLPSGDVLVAGGDSAPSVPVSSAELYHPATATWSATGSMSFARASHTATLLQSGHALVAGGGTPSAETYDLATGVWTSIAPMSQLRSSFASTLMPNGLVLSVGGTGLGNAEVFDPGLGFQIAWQPTLTGVTASLPSGAALVASGTGFTGTSEASGGNGAQNSPSNDPVVQLHSLANEQVSYLSVDPTAGWTATSFTSTAITTTLPIGYGLATLFTNGIPSTSQVVYLGSAPIPTVTPTATVTPKATLTPTATRTPVPTRTPKPGGVSRVLLPVVANGAAAGW